MLKLIIIFWIYFHINLETNTQNIAQKKNKQIPKLVEQSNNYPKGEEKHRRSSPQTLAGGDERRWNEEKPVQEIERREAKDRQKIDRPAQEKLRFVQEIDRTEMNGRRGFVQ